MLELGPLGYGLLLGAFGAGAVVTAVLVLSLRRRPSLDALVTAGSAVFGAVALLLAIIAHRPAAYATMFFAGGAWIATIASLNVAVQRTSPTWVRARALSIYTLVFQGGLATGSLVCGMLATQWGTAVVLALAGARMIASALATSGRASALWRRATGSVLRVAA